MNMRTGDPLFAVAWRVCIGAAVVIATAPAVLAKHTLTKVEESVVATWVAQHVGLRLATARDCSCDEDIRNIRAGYGGLWKPVPDYDPYKASGDFNGDGVDDIAVVVLDTRRKSDAFVLVVFNGPFGAQPQAAFTTSELDLKQRGLFYGPPRPKPYRLLLGPFESDNTLMLVPSGGSYRLK